MLMKHIVFSGKPDYFEEHVLRKHACQFEARTRSWSASSAEEASKIRIALDKCVINGASNLRTRAPGKKTKKRLDPFPKGPSRKKHKSKLPSPVFEHVPYAPGMKSDFYRTREWRTIRFQVLNAGDGLCKLCGRGVKDGCIMHVDHILPRSKFPRLELQRDNLQVLCEDCNLGKSDTVPEFAGKHFLK